MRMSMSLCVPPSIASTTAPLSTPIRLNIATSPALEIPNESIAVIRLEL